MNPAREQPARDANWDPTVYPLVISSGVLVRSAGRKVDKCWACKKARETCDLVYPKCGTCENAGRRCTGFGARPLKFLDVRSFDPTTTPEGGKASKGTPHDGKSPRKKHRFPPESQAGPAYTRPRQSHPPGHEDDDKLQNDPLQLQDRRPQGLRLGKSVPQLQHELNPRSSAKGKQPVPDFPGFGPGSRDWMKWYRPQGQEFAASFPSAHGDALQFDIGVPASSEENQSQDNNPYKNVLVSQDLTGQPARDITPEPSPMLLTGAIPHRKSPKDDKRNNRLFRDILDHGKWIGWTDPNPRPRSRAGAPAKVSHALSLDGNLTNCAQVGNRAPDEATIAAKEPFQSASGSLTHKPHRFRRELQQISGVDTVVPKAGHTENLMAHHETDLSVIEANQMIASGRIDGFKEALASTTTVALTQSFQPLTTTLRSRQSRRRDMSKKRNIGQETTMLQSLQPPLQPNSQPLYSVAPHAHTSAAQSQSQSIGTFAYTIELPLYATEAKTYATVTDGEPANKTLEPSTACYETISVPSVPRYAPSGPEVLEPNAAVPVNLPRKHGQVRDSASRVHRDHAAYPSSKRAPGQIQSHVKPSMLDPSVFPFCPIAHDKMPNNKKSPLLEEIHYNKQDNVNPIDVQPPTHLPSSQMIKTRSICREDVAKEKNINCQRMARSNRNTNIGAAMRQLHNISASQRRAGEKQSTREDGAMENKISSILELAARLRYEQEATSINQIQQGPTFLSQMISVLINTIFPTEHEKQYSLIRNSYLSHLPQLDLDSLPVLKFAVVMLCLSQIGNYNNDSRLTHEAEVFYGKTLKTLMLHVPHRIQKAVEATTVVTSMLLLTIRTDTFTSASAIGVDWKVHYRGAEGYLHINGQHWLNMCGASDRLIYRNVKEPTLWINLSQRRSPEMTPQQWLNCEEFVTSHSLLFAMGLNMAQLLERTETHCTVSSAASLMRLAEDWLALRKKLLDWADTFEKQRKEVRQMKRRVTDIYDAKSFKMDNEVHCFLKSNAVFSVFFGFYDSMSEMTEPERINFVLRLQLQRYWIFCLIMHCALMRLAFYHPGQFSHHLHFQSDYAMSRTLQRAATCHADNLCRLFLYLSISEQQGDIDFMHVICDMVKNYYAEIGSLQKSSWCQGVGEAIAKRRERLTQGKARTVCRMSDLHEDLSNLTRWAMPPVPKNY